MQGQKVDGGQKRLDNHKLVQSSHPQGGHGKAGDGRGLWIWGWRWEEGGGGSRDDGEETKVADDRKGVVL